MWLLPENSKLLQKGKILNLFLFCFFKPENSNNANTECSFYMKIIKPKHLMWILPENSNNPNIECGFYLKIIITQALNVGFT